MSSERQRIHADLMLDELKDKAREWDILAKENLELRGRIDKAIEYINEHSLYEQDYDYDYEENLTEYPPDDTRARNDLLEILKGEDKE